MKKFGVFTVSAISTFCFLFGFSPLKVHATTVSMDFVGVGGENSGGVYTYPYYFKINGEPEVPLMCVSYLQEIQVPETWQATITAIGTATPSLTVTDEEEDAYLDSVVLNSGSSAQTVSDAQWAAWEVGDSGLIGHLPGGLNDAAITAEYDAAVSFVSTHTLANDPNFYDGFELYVPVPGSQSPVWDGLPQTFIGPAPTPEPNSLFLLGSGLLAAAGALYRRNRQTA